MKLKHIALIILITGLMGWLSSRQISSVGAQAGSGHTDCLACHARPNLVGKFSNGDTISLYFDPTQHASSMHAERGLGCQACHAEQSDYPHPLSSANTCFACHTDIANSQEIGSTELVFEIPLETPRILSLQLNEACQRCHQIQADAVVDSDHERISANGNAYAPVCLDCHGSHNVVKVSASRSNTPQICAKCHLAVYTTYESSVHGSALHNEANPDVPTCGDCHGTHVVKGPDQPNFRADSINLCGHCHADEALMSKYGISTEVFNTYLDDFHGRTVDYSREAKVGTVNKATCYDCHGVHNILAPEQAASTVSPVNLLDTCQHCHPDAGLAFQQAWLSHRVPDWKNAPIVFLVTQVFQILIPTVMGACLVYVALDFQRRLRDRRKKIGTHQ